MAVLSQIFKVAKMMAPYFPSEISKRYKKYKKQLGEF
jgi:hypothetical protein